MSESKKRNVNFPNQCKRCAKSYSVEFEHFEQKVQGCRYTKFSNRYIKNCPCSNCLISIICKEPCDILISNPDYKSKIWSYTNF